MTGLLVTGVFVLYLLETVTNNLPKVYLTVSPKSANYTQESENPSVLADRSRTEEFSYLSGINWTDTNRVNSSRYLFYHCKSNCGGFGDRLRGIVNAFILSRITGRKFGILHPKPCPLENFLEENKYNWKINVDDLDNRSSKLYSFMSARKLPSDNMTSYFKEDIVYIKTNTDITIGLMRQADVPRRIPWISTMSTADLYRSVLTYLFVLNKDLQEELDIFRSKFVKNNKTVCAHYRVGKNPTFKNDVSRNVGNISLLWSFLSRHDKDGYVIYLATDSEETQSLANLKFQNRVINIPGKLVHTERSKDDSECSGFKKTILEHRFLTECDVLLLTDSGYGRTAGFLRRHSQELYCLQKTGVYRCSRTTLPGILPGAYSACAW